MRLHDNHGLYTALKSDLPVLPVFIFDKSILDSLEKNDARVSFIYQTLSNINIKLQDFGSSLMVMHEQPIDAFKKFCDKYQVKEVYTNHDYEPYAIQRDRELETLLHSKNISFNTFKDQVIFEKHEVLKNDGTPYTIFTPYSRVWKEELIKKPIVFFPSEKLSRNYYQTTPFQFPSLSEIGFHSSNISIPDIIIDEKGHCYERHQGHRYRYYLHGQRCPAINGDHLQV